MRTFLIALCLSGVVLFSQQAMNAARQAAQVFSSGVLPALFPMMVLTRLLPAGSGALWQTTLLGFASGSPASAQRVQALWRARKAQNPEFLMALCGVMSPMFFTGSIARWTGNARAAWTLLFLHWLSAGVTALIWRAFTQEQPAICNMDVSEEPPRLAAVIRQSAESMLGVCGAMMVFSIFAGVARAVLGALFPQWVEGHQLLLNTLWALAEIGGGTAAIAQENSAVPWALLGGLCSFGGLSIWLQNLLFAPECIRPAKLLGMRALHGAICYGFGFIAFS